MNSTPWKQIVNLLLDGEPVDAPTTNRPLQHLAQRTQALYERLTAMLAGEALVERDAPLAEDTFVGAGVYKANDGTWKNALAAVAEDATLGYYTLPESAQVAGIVLEKHTSTLGSVVLFGHVTDMDWSAAVEGGYESGQYYLSSQTAGKLTRQQPAVSIPLAIIRPGVAQAYVNTALRDVLEDHVHVRVALEDAPAGTPRCNEFGDQHEILCPDEDAMGWLPADHASFDGNAPSGAAFGYNLAAHPELYRIWPAAPLDSVYIEVDGVGVPTGYSDTATDVQIIVNRYGIWWMNGCYGQAPWKDPWYVCSHDEDCIDLESESGYYEAPVDVSCPIEYRRRINLFFTRMTFKTDATVVTSLEAAAGSPLSVVRAIDGLPAKTGDLVIGLSLNFSIQDGIAGHLAIKTASGNSLGRGPVVESIRAADSSIEVVSSVGAGAAGQKYANIVLRAVSATNLERELEVQVVALQKATEETFQDVLFFGLPNERSSTVRLMTTVPDNFVAAGTGAKLRFRIWALGTLAGALPDLTYTFRRIGKPDDECDSVALPETDTALVYADQCNAALTAPYQYVEFLTPAIDVLGGDKVFCSISREDDDAYAGMVGLLKIVPVLTLE